MLIALGMGFHATFFDMGRIWWTSSTFNHGFLILPIAVYLGWQKRTQVATLSPALSWWGVTFAAANGVLWVTGELMSIAFFKHAAVVGMVIATGWSLMGNRLFRLLLFPFLYLYFAVPEGEFLVPYLQDWTATVLVEMLRLTGIPVFIEGRYLAIPSGNFVVAEACSGINYLIATLAVGAMFMYMNFRSWWRRTVFMLVAIVVPLVANGLRAYGIVMIAHLSDYRYAMGIDHFIYGWVFFGVVIFALFWIGNLFSDVDEVDDEPPPPPSRRLPRVAPSTMIVVLLIAIFLPRGLLALNDSTRTPGPEISLPVVPGWDGPTEVAERLGATFPGADEYLAGTYRDAEGHEVELEVMYFRAEGTTGELINQSNSIYDETIWKQLDYHTRRAPPGVVSPEIYELRLRNESSAGEYVVWQWYDAQGVRAASRLPIKLAQAWARLHRARSGAASVSVRTTVEEGLAVRELLTRFSSNPAIKLEHFPSRPAERALPAD